MLIEESKEQKNGYIGLVFFVCHRGVGIHECFSGKGSWEMEKSRVWESCHMLFILLEYVCILVCSLYKF